MVRTNDGTVVDTIEGRDPEGKGNPVSGTGTELVDRYGFRYDLPPFFRALMLAPLSAHRAGRQVS